MPEREMRVTLLSHTPNSENIAYIAARNCYSSAELSEMLHSEIDPVNVKKRIDGVMDSGHHSVIEHISYTFAIEGVSRTLLAQITRHRIASFSVQSQRYVSFNGQEFGFIIPERIKALGPSYVTEFRRQMRIAQNWYNFWCESLGKDSEEDARFVLPGAATTQIVMTMNARELLHFFSLRMCNRAQWEIRALAWKMYELVYPTAPAIFAHGGPSCANGPCPEGLKTCGKVHDMRAKVEAIRNAKKGDQEREEMRNNK